MANTSTTVNLSGESAATWRRNFVRHSRPMIPNWTGSDMVMLLVAGRRDRSISVDCIGHENSGGGGTAKVSDLDLNS